MISVYDTMARAVVPVTPAEPERLTMYSCGPTVYRYAHVGNLRTFMTADLLRRAFEYTGTPVHQVQNITDVGHMTDELFGEGGRDRMEIAVEVEGKSASDIAAFYTEHFLADAAAMNLQRAAAYPRASDHVPQMIEIITRLIEHGHAYEASGTVYYDVTSFPAYGRLSGNTIDQLRADHRKEIGDTNKRTHADFVLWMSAGPNRLITFPSPWGLGYPGWHIECSAMSMEHFGPSFDIHTGGEDNVFPHHEDEIAQSDGATGGQVVRHWVHAAHLLMDGRKMSKSAQNFYDLRDLAERGHTEPLAARLLFLQSRYRAQMNFTLTALAAAERTLARWRRVATEWRAAETTNQSGPSDDAHLLEKRFANAVRTDLDTPGAIALVAEVVSSKTLAPGDKAALLARWDGFLGLDLMRAPPAATEIPAAVASLALQRERARQNRDWTEADRIRDEITAAGFAIDDAAGGSVLRPLSP